jgi:hypothetical protein
MELASLPVMAVRRRQWTALKDLRAERPMVLFETWTLENYVAEDELACQDPELRRVEKAMRAVIRQAEEIGNATESVQVLSESVNRVSHNAAESAHVAEQSLDFARKGGDSVRDAIAGMNDTDAEYVLGTCLSVVQRQTTATSWAPVWSEKAKACMFDDVDMGVMVKLALEVVKDSLGPFIRGLLTSLPEASPDSQPAAG